jgi:para-aminobenzoate synthetase / 4-amino-4-deoxychorismate lyase
MDLAPADQTIPPLTSIPRPDPAQGVFETLLVRGGAPVELDAHLERMAASLAALYGTELPPGLAHEVRERARHANANYFRGPDPRNSSHSLGRLRIAVGGEPGASAEIAIEAVDPADVFPGPERAAALRSVRREGGLGRHKWNDRSGLSAVGDPALPLLLDASGEVLEASRANVFAAHEWALHTPPDDGRILPGIARARVIEAAAEAGIRVEERPLSRADLLGADEVFLTGSVRGVEPAGSLDGAALAGLGELGRRVAGELDRRWRTDRLSATRS